MKIALFTDTFLPQVNGVVTSIINCTHHMAERGHQISIIVPKSKSFEYNFHPNITIKKIVSIPALFYQDFKFSTPLHPGLLNYVYKRKFDIIHFHTPMTLGLQAILLGKMLRIPVIGTFHTFFADPQYLKHLKLNFKLAEKIGWRYSNIYYNSSDLVTCHSNTTMLELIKNGCTKSIKVISNGIDSSIFDNSQSASVRKECKINNYLLLYVGRIAHEKNIPFLLQTFKIVTGILPGVKLMLVGEGPQMNEIKKLITSLAIHENIIMKGNIKYTELVKSGIYGAADLFVTASKTENQPMSILEAMANNVVCVGVNSRGIPELIEHNKTGLVVEPDNKYAFADAIVTLLKDDSLRLRLKNNISKFIIKHNIEKVLIEWENTYNNLIKLNKSQKPSQKHIQAMNS